MELENQELILLELEEFNKKSENEAEITQNMENLIEFVSKTGKTIFPWNLLKNLYLLKLNQVIDNFHSESSSNIKIDETKERIIDRFKTFPNAPFTIQRISELMLKPKSNYNKKDKYLSGLEKCIMVVTCVDPQGDYIYS